MAENMEESKLARKVRFNIPVINDNVEISHPGVQNFERNFTQIPVQAQSPTPIRYVIKSNNSSNNHSTQKYVNGMLVDVELLNNNNNTTNVNRNENDKKDNGVQKENIHNHKFVNHQGISIYSSLKNDEKFETSPYTLNRSVTLPQLSTEEKNIKNDRFNAGQFYHSKTLHIREKPLREIKPEFFNNNNSGIKKSSSSSSFPVKTTHYDEKNKKSSSLSKSTQKYLTVPTVDVTENLTDSFDNENIISSKKSTIHESYIENKCPQNLSMLQSDKTYVFDFLERWRRQRNFINQKIRSISPSSKIRGVSSENLHTKENHNQSVSSHICFRLDEKKRRLVFHFYVL